MKSMRNKMKNIVFETLNKVIQILSITTQYFIVFFLFFTVLLLISFCLLYNVVNKLYKINYKFFKKGEVNVFISNERRS